MKRSEQKWPRQHNALTDTLKIMWERGWFDEFSEDHFLIRAINGDLPEYRTKPQVNMSSPELYNDCDTYLNFIINFSSTFYRFISFCGSDNAERFVRDQLSAGKSNYSEDQFFGALHEIHVFTYLTSFGKPSVDYEPMLSGSSGKKNPEYRIKNSFMIPGKDASDIIYKKEDYIFDVEVKSIVGQLNKNIDLEKPFITPSMAIEYSKKDKLFTLCNELELQVELPNVIQLREFLNSAASKFSSLLHKNHFNLLYINWTHREIPILNYIEPLSLLDNPVNGLLRYKDIGQKFKISNDVFEKISAIFIYSYPKQALIFGDIRWVFAKKQCAILFNPSLTPEQQLKLTRILSMNPSANPQIQPFLLYLPNKVPIKPLTYSNFEELANIIKQIRFK